jgi:hypothetical protein
MEAIEGKTGASHIRIKARLDEAMKLGPRKHSATSREVRAWFARCDLGFPAGLEMGAGSASEFALPRR